MAESSGFQGHSKDPVGLDFEVSDWGAAIFLNSPPDSSGKVSYLQYSKVVYNSKYKRYYSVVNLCCFII